MEGVVEGLTIVGVTVLEGVTEDVLVVEGVPVGVTDVEGVTDGVTLGVGDEEGVGVGDTRVSAKAFTADTMLFRSVSAPAA